MPILNLEKNDNKSATPSIKYRIYACNIDDIDVAAFPIPDETMSIKAAELKLKTGKAFHFLDVIPNTFKPNAKSVGEIAPQFQLEIPSEVKGISANTLKYMQENNGEEQVVIWEHCATGQKFIAGNDCGGLKFICSELGIVGDYQGAKISWKGYPSCSAYYYFTGEVPTTPAV